MTTEQLMAARPKAPCGRDCPDRKPGCGAVCEKWKQYEAERDAWYKAKFQDSERLKLPVRGQKRKDNAPTLKKRYPGRL